MNIRYYFRVFLSIPLLPLMYFHSKSVRAKTPELPEAEGREGITRMDTKHSLSILSIGESMLAGVGVATHAEGFTGTLASDLAAKFQASISWKVYAKSGYTAKNVTENILPNIEESTTDLIVIGLGANDAFTLNSPRKWNAQINTLIKDLRSKFGETPIVFTNMPPIKEFPAFTSVLKLTVGNLIEFLGEELQKIAKKNSNVYYYDRILSLDDWVSRLNIEIGQKKFFSDGVHPSKITYQIWAKDFANFINNHVQLKKELQLKMS